MLMKIIEKCPQCSRGCIMSNLPIFSHPSFGTVRIVERNDEPWFVAKDVAKALGYASTNMTTIFQAVPEEWKGSNPITTLGGEQEMLIISEQGLYFFLGRSDKPVALPFQKWLAGDVIPSIRKHGLYATEEVVDRILDDPISGSRCSNGTNSSVNNASLPNPRGTRPSVPRHGSATGRRPQQWPPLPSPSVRPQPLRTNLGGAGTTRP